MPAAPQSQPRLQVEGISKSFPGVRALQNVEMHLQQGEVLSVVGENGAGKSTLMKILAGVQRQDSGSVRVDGKTVSFASVSDAMDAGIALINKEKRVKK